MIVMVSSCLLGEKCRYNGSDALSQKVLTFTKDMEVISFCPEVMSGMNTPRESSEIVNESGKLKVKTKSGNDVTDFFSNGAKLSLDLANNKNVDLIILKSKSPSCGVYKIYDGTFSGTLIKGAGLTAALLKENNLKIITEDDL